MTAPNQTRDLLREWKAARTVRECVNERDETPDGSEGAKAIATFKDSSKAITEAVMAQQNDSFAIADLAALLELAIVVAEDEVTEDASEAMPIVRKAWRAIKTLRDVGQREPQGPTLEERRSSACRVLQGIEYQMQELLALLRIVTARAKEIDTAATGLEGSAHDREYELRNDVLIVLEHACAKASAVDEAALGCVHDAMRCLK